MYFSRFTRCRWPFFAINSYFPSTDSHVIKWNSDSDFVVLGKSNRNRDASLMWSSIGWKGVVCPDIIITLCFNQKWPLSQGVRQKSGFRRRVWLGIRVCAFYPLFEEKMGIVLLSGSEVGLESEIFRRFEVPWIRKSHFPSFIIYADFVIRTSLSVFDRLSWNLDIMCKYGWICAK